VRQDAAAIARPLVGLLIAGGGDDDTGARVALELLLLEERLQVGVAAAPSAAPARSSTHGFLAPRALTR